MPAVPAPAPAATSSPALSVVLVVGGQRERGAAALRSLLEQELRGGIEVLLFDLGPKESSPLDGSNDSRVMTCRPQPPILLTEAQVQGVQQARAPVVAFMEEHCEAQPGWAQAVVDTLRDRWAGVSGDFILKNPGSGTSSKSFRMTYGAYLPPASGRGPARLVAGQNAAYKRDLLLSYGDRLPRLMQSDAGLQLALSADGHECFYEPAARIAHRNENTVGSLCRGAFYWNWCFANVRAELLHWSFWRKALRVAAIPLVPWVRLVRLTSWVAPRGPAAVMQLLRDVPYVLAIHHASAAGQLAGLLFGVEKAERAFSHFEMNEPRLSRSEWERARTS